MIKENLISIKEKIAKTCKTFNRDSSKVKIIAVSKTIASEKITEAINLGCKIFAENYVKEARDKWLKIRQEYPSIELHLIGHLQSNKVKEAIETFDCIQTVDSKKLAIALKKEMIKQGKKIDLMLQVNIGDEAQKYGIKINEIAEFINFCKNELDIEFAGIMAIPPSEELASPYFALLKKIANQYNFSQISMGMSGDFEEAIALGATHIRLGTAIFGQRIKK